MDQSKLSKPTDKQLVPNSRLVKSAGEYEGAKRGKICDGLQGRENDWFWLAPEITTSYWIWNLLNQIEKKITHAIGFDVPPVVNIHKEKKMREKEVGRKLEGMCT